MKVGLVHRDLHTVTRGGICTLYRELAPRLRDLGHEVVLITQDTPHPVSIRGVDFVTLPRTDDLDAHRAAASAAIAAMGPGIVECSSWEAELLHYLRRPQASRVPVVVRGDLSASTMGAQELLAAERELLARADAVLAVSRFAAKDLTSAYGINPPTVVANAVDQDRFRPLHASPPRSGHQITIDRTGTTTTRTPLQGLSESGTPPPPWSTTDDRPSIVWVGKITPMKGWDRLEALLPRLRRHATVVIVLGHSPAYLPVSITGDQDAVILQDLDDVDMAGLYNAADHLLSTSRWEGFGLAAAEALACGTPALLPAQLGTASELLAQGGGRTYANDDELIRLLNSPSPSAGQMPSQFDWDANAAKTAAIYEEALAQHPPSQSSRRCASS